MFFAPLFRPGAEIVIWGPRARRRRRCATASRRYISAPLTPDRDPRAALRRLVPRGATRRSGTSARRRSAPRRHPPRADARLPDHRGRRSRSSTSPTTSRGWARRWTTLEDEWISGLDLARGADLLIHDAQYTDEEYPRPPRLGALPGADALTFARRAEATAAAGVPPRPAAHRRRPRPLRRGRSSALAGPRAGSRQASRWRPSRCEIDIGEPAAAAAPARPRRAPRACIPAVRPRTSSSSTKTTSLGLVAEQLAVVDSATNSWYGGALGHALEARGGVGRVADRRVLQPPLRADVAGHHAARC